MEQVDLSDIGRNNTRHIPISSSVDDSIELAVDRRRQGGRAKLGVYPFSQSAKAPGLGTLAKNAGTAVI